MKKNIIILLLLIVSFNQLNAQNNCAEKLTGDNVLRWRGVLKFTPRYMTVEKMEYVILRLSERAYNQISIELRSDCRDNKQNFIQNMEYFWNYKISKSQLEEYFPAYYMFYSLDKSAFIEDRTK